MKFSASAMIMATMAAGEAMAGAFGHSSPKHNHAARHSQQMEGHQHTRAMKRGSQFLTASDNSRLAALGFKSAGLNPTSKNSGNVWIGTDGTYTNEVFNQGEEDLVFTVWGPFASWVNAQVPQITLSIPANSSQTVSFSDGFSGAFSAVYADTKLVNGQVSETWGECTFNGIWSTCDVSREVNMSGKKMTIVTPTCISDFTRCVFQCKDAGVSSCMYDYELVNCQKSASQPGAAFGQASYDGGKTFADSGGCMIQGDASKNNAAKLQTYLNYN